MDSIADGLLHAVTLATAAGVTLWAAGAIYFDACRGAGWGRWVAAGWVAGVVATFGFLRVETSVANVTGAHITSGYRWWTAAGARRSLADDGLTFGTNADRGVCVHFREKVPSRLRRGGHSAITVTVADPDALVAALGPA